MRADVEENRRGILILTLSTEPALSFLVLITPTPVNPKSRLTQTLHIFPIPNVNVKYKMQKIWNFLKFFRFPRTYALNHRFLPKNAGIFVKTRFHLHFKLKLCDHSFWSYRFHTRPNFLTGVGAKSGEISAASKSRGGEFLAMWADHRRFDPFQKRPLQWWAKAC